MQRKNTLLIEYQQTRKANDFNDRRFGGASPDSCGSPLKLYAANLVLEAQILKLPNCTRQTGVLLFQLGLRRHVPKRCIAAGKAGCDVCATPVGGGGAGQGRDDEALCCHAAEDNAEMTEEERHVMRFQKQRMLDAAGDRYTLRDEDGGGLTHLGRSLAEFEDDLPGAPAHTCARNHHVRLKVLMGTWPVSGSECPPFSLLRA